MLEEDWDEMEVNEPGRQTSRQEAKHTKLYPGLLKAFKKREPLMAMNS